MKKLPAFLVLLGLAAGGLLWAVERDPRVAAEAATWAGRIGVAIPFAAASAESERQIWRTAPVERGPMQAAVLATGTLQPVQTVQVSSQVSGQIVEIVADFNAKVKTGDPIARLDPTTFQGRLASAEADLAVAEATVVTKRSGIDKARADLVRYEEASRDADRALERNRQLVRSGSVTERALEIAEVLSRQTRAQVAAAKADIATAEAEAAVAQANVEQKRAAVRIAKTDLDRTFIRAPIDGIVIDRQVELGQTVAASLSAPTLFVIAADLAEMQLEASIDEADVGRVREGQSVQFTVDAYPGRTFDGKVSQVRRAAKSVQNVVTYTAVVTADNSSMALFPGMTANVRLVTDRKPDVLKVPQAAIRFRPGQSAEPTSGSGKVVRAVRPSAAEGTRARVHVLRPGGALEAVDVAVGLTADNFVEVSGGGLAQGDQVAIGRLADASDRRRAPLGF